MDGRANAAEEARLRARAAARRAAEARRRREQLASRFREVEPDHVERRERAVQREAAAHRSALEVHLRTARLLEEHARALDARGDAEDAERCRARAVVQRRHAELERERLDQSREG